MAMYQLPFVAEPPVDMCHPERLRPWRATIHDHLPAFKANRVGEVAAGKRDSVVWNQLSTFETAADPPEGLRDLPMTPFDGAPGSKERGVTRLRPAVRIWLGILSLASWSDLLPARCSVASERRS